MICHVKVLGFGALFQVTRLKASDGTGASGPGPALEMRPVEAGIPSRVGTRP